MVFIVETGSGTPGANALASVAFVTAYLTDRGREAENDWVYKTELEQQAFIVAATDYIETRWGQRFKGSKANTLIAGRSASGRITLSGLPANGETLTLGQKTYRMVNALTQENDVLIGADVTETIANLVEAINYVGELGTTYQEDTLPNYEALAFDEDPSLVVAALTVGESGNLIAWSTTIALATITGTGFLEDGLDESEQPLSFPRIGLYTRDGKRVIGVPLKAKQACAEYSVRAAAVVLAPDPTIDARLAPVAKVREKVGPIETETQYANGALPTLIKPYPAADRLLAEYVTAAGGVIRG